jgi:cell division protein FtsN
VKTQTTIPESKTNLLVFTKKEVFLILFLLILVSLFSFTLGLKLGKNLAQREFTQQEKLTATSHEEPFHAVEDSVAPESHADKAVHTESNRTDEVVSPEHMQNKEEELLGEELKKDKPTAKKEVPLTIPSEKRGLPIRYTLQVGSYRTIGEAAEQVALLKRRSLEAFYLEASVPGKGNWYRVGIGNFETKEEAEKMAQKWKALHSLPPFIITSFKQDASGE